MPHCRLLLPLVLAISCLFTGCAGQTLQRFPDGTYERESTAAKEQRTADALRRDSASEAARDAQKRADRALEEERRSPGSNFFLDFLYMLFGIAVENKTQK